MNIDTARLLVAGKPWHHDFEIVPGVRTHGSYNPDGTWLDLALPEDMAGMTLADVGASNGYYSFRARRANAKVVAFDFRHRDNSGFGLAQYINGLEDIAHHQVNVLNLRAAQYGKFDVVLCLGLLYHISDPYLALSNCAALSQGRLLVESYCIDPLLPLSMSEQPIMRFICDPERFPMREQPNADPSNFWGFNATCLKLMVEDLGFRVDRCLVRGDRVLIDASRTPGGANRLHIAYGTVAAKPRGQDPTQPGAWVFY